MSQLEFRPGLADVPVAESAISFIDGQRARLEYRGIAVETLARDSSFEETAWLLLKGELPTQRELADFDSHLRRHRRLKYKLKDLLKCLPETGHPMGALQAAVAAMGMFYPVKGVANPDSNWLSAVRLIAKLPTIVAAFHRLRYGDANVQPRDDLTGTDDLTGVERERPREHAGDDAVAFAMQARVDDPRELDVVVPEHRGRHDREDGTAPGEWLQQPVPAQPWGPRQRQVRQPSSPRASRRRVPPREPGPR